VEREALLGTVRPDEMAGEPPRALVVCPGEVAAVRPLDLDDARALVGEQPGAVWRGDRLLQRDDGEPVERAAHASLASAVMARSPSAFAAQSFTMPSASG